jgi:hypothetical protein
MLGIRNWILPPRASQIVSNLVKNKAIILSHDMAEESQLDTLIWASRGEMHWIPIAKCVTDIGTSFSPSQNPLVRYLESGFLSMWKYYQIFQPTDSFEMVSVQTHPRQVNSGKGVFRKPWANIGVEILGGGQFWGPRSDYRIVFDANLLKGIRSSILKEGYLPRRSIGQPFPQFRLLIDDRSAKNWDYRVIVHGNHRTAVLASLGWKCVPMTPGAGSVIRLSELTKWPGVVDGTYKQKDAHRFFRSYFNQSGSLKLPNWTN